MNAIVFSVVGQQTQALALRIALGGVCLCVTVLIAGRLLRRRPEPLRFGILFCGVMGLLAMPVLVGLGQNLPAHLVRSEVEPEVEILRVGPELLPKLLEERPPEPGRVDETDPGDVEGFLGLTLLLAWTVGSLFCLVRLIFGYAKQRRLILGRPWRPDFWTDARRADLAEKLGLSSFPDVYESPATPMPMVVGLWRPVIVLPERAPNTWSQSHWEAVLLHEAAHIARRDPWAVMAQRAAVSLFWWCPLVHLLAHRLNELRENICDDFALQGSCDRIDYAAILVETADHMLNLKASPVPVGLLDSTRGGLEARVVRLLEKERIPMTRLSMPGKLLAAIFVVCGSILTLASTAFSGGQPAPQKKIQIKIIVDGKEIDLTDARLLEHIEAAQKKAAGTHTFKIYGIVQDPTAPGAGPKTPAPQDKLTARFVIGGPKLDPRIEELVKQAEKIKPGSGAEVRRALQGIRTDGQFFFHAIPVPGPGAAKPEIRPFPGAKIWEMKTGKKVIILKLEDGKIIQLQEAELKKLIPPVGALNLEFNLHKHLLDELRKKAAAEKAKAKPGAFEFEFSIPIAPSSKTKPAPTPNATDLDALRRQLERLNAELNELRKRVDSNRK